MGKQLGLLWANTWDSSGRMDAVMWGACGVEAACVYALQCKCNHACDAVCLTGVSCS